MCLMNSVYIISNSKLKQDVAKMIATYFSKLSKSLGI